MYTYFDSFSNMRVKSIGGELTAETENYDRGAYLRELQHEYEEEVEAEEQAEKSIISAISTSSAFESSEIPKSACFYSHLRCKIH